MKKKFTLFFALMCAVGLGAQPYRDAKQSVEQRVEDLLKRMTPEEKVAQYSQMMRYYTGS